MRRRVAGADALKKVNRTVREEWNSEYATAKAKCRSFDCAQDDSVLGESGFRKATATATTNAGPSAALRMTVFGWVRVRKATTTTTATATATAGHSTAALTMKL